MTKKPGKDNPAEKARRRLAKVQLKLSAAQDEHAQERVRGQQEIERARLQAAKWLAKAAQRVDRRSEQVSQAEGDVQAAATAANPKGLIEGGGVKRATPNGTDPMPTTAEATADLLQEQVKRTPDVKESAIAMSEGITSAEGGGNQL